MKRVLKSVTQARYIVYIMLILFITLNKLKKSLLYSINSQDPYMGISPMPPVERSDMNITQQYFNNINLV